MQTPILKITGLHKSFGDNEVLKGIDLDVMKGQLVFMIGPSGSGKSTLLRCCNRLEEPSSGSILVDQEDITAAGADLNRIRQNIGMVFQHFNLYRHMSVLNNVTLALRKVQKLSKEEANTRGLEALRRVGLLEKSSAFPDQLSGGQQQRVAIARALALNPEVLLLDEITSALDPELVGEVLDVVRELKGSGITLLLATHEMGFAREISDRVCFLADGVVAEMGLPEQIFSHPADPRTQQFLQRVIAAGRLRG